MRRRDFLVGGTSVPLLFGQQPPESATAGASQDTTPRVGIVLSSFKGSQDHDGTEVPGLTDPRPANADLTDVQLDAMVRKTIDVGNTRQGTLAKIVEAEDWIVLKPHTGGTVRGGSTDPRIVRAVIEYLLEYRRGLRFTIGAGSDEWTALASDLAKRHPKVKFDTTDLKSAETVEMTGAKHTFAVPRILRECDRFITLSPLKTDAATGVSLAIKNSLVAAPASGDLNEIVPEIFALRPADYALIGGAWGVEGDVDTPVHHNLLIGGTNALAVDAIGAAVMGFRDLPFLKSAWKLGLGTFDLDNIWTRGNEIQEARRAFRKHSGFKG